MQKRQRVIPINRNILDFFANSDGKLRRLALASKRRTYSEKDPAIVEITTW
jgi:hypothetical protein